MMENKQTRNIIELTDDQISLLKANGTIVNNGDNYMFLPFWFKELGDNKFEMFQLGSVPDDLIEYLTKVRDTVTNHDSLSLPLTPDDCLDTTEILGFGFAK